MSIQDKDQNQARLVRGREFAETIGIPRQRLYAWLQAGDAIPPTRIICKISYWASNICEDFTQGRIRKNAEGVWCWDGGRGDPVPVDPDHPYPKPTPPQPLAA